MDRPLYELAGGSDVIRALLHDFYDTGFADVMSRAAIQLVRSAGSLSATTWSRPR